MIIYNRKKSDLYVSIFLVIFACLSILFILTRFFQLNMIIVFLFLVLMAVLLYKIIVSHNISIKLDEHMFYYYVSNKLKHEINLKDCSIKFAFKFFGKKMGKDFDMFLIISSPSLGEKEIMLNITPIGKTESHHLYKEMSKHANKFDKISDEYAAFLE